MHKSVLAFLLCLCASALSQQQNRPEAAGIVPATQEPRTETKPAVREKEPETGFVSPAEVNVNIEADPRTFVVMAAVNIAGFDYEPSGVPLSPVRAELRKDLAGVDPQLKARLAEFYRSHRRPGVDEAVDAERYAALSLMMTAPPGFSIYSSPDHTLPADLRPLVDFAPLVREFYLSGRLRELIPKYTKYQNYYVAAYRRPVGELIYQVLEYFHARPETIISMKPLVVSEGEPGRKDQKAKIVARNRTRQMFIVPDPLAAINVAIVRGDILNQKESLLHRRVGDDYIVVIGPSRNFTLDPVRQALIRFVIDPLVERKLKYSLQFKDDFVKLASSVPTASKEYSASVYMIVRESLAQAAEARLRRIQSGTKGSYTEDDAVFDLAEAYQRGAVLSFHFYNSLIGFEKVGIGIDDFFEQMIETVKWDRESARPKEFEPVVARVIAERGKAEKAAASSPEAAMSPVARKILVSDDLIRQRRFVEARPILKEVLDADPNNARALYGMAQVVTQSPSTIELDPNADENDKIQAQHDRLELAIKLFRNAIANGSMDTEPWLIQWSHVYLGRILDFQEFRADAVAEYEKAIAMGEVANGALKEAKEGKEKPFGQKQ